MLTNKLLFSMLVILAANLARADDAAPNFADDVLPLLKQHCVQCHGPAKQEGKLSLAVPPAIKRGGKHGSSVVSGYPEQSLLWQRVAADEMPPEKPLSAEDKAILRRWIAAGAVGLPQKVSATPDGDEHGAFQSLKSVDIPSVKTAEGLRTPIDRFIAAKLEAAGLTLSPEASRETLIRRVSFDITGLPPSPAEIDVFLQDSHPQAYKRMVERYLNSERYGERWGKYWLDAAGYADSNGYFGADTDRPLAYRYRDYVIRSINADRPWDQFIREQIAGDELAGYRRGGDVLPEMVELLEAAHFIRNSPDGTDSSLMANPGREVRGRQIRRRSKAHCRSWDSYAARPDRAMCPLPQSQIRAVHAARLLSVTGGHLSGAEHRSMVEAEGT